jgi:DUF4097 and DUF4098 domain-containing protein YvlB
MMKKTRTLLFTFLLATMAMAVAAQEEHDEDETEQRVAQVSATQSVAVNICVGSGNVVVRGWDKNEVLVTMEDDQSVQFRRQDGTPETAPATSLEILFTNDEETSPHRMGGCSASGDLTLNVPHGAKVFLRTMEGDVDVENVGEAHVDSASGNLSARNISDGTELKTASGDVTVENAAGRLRLSSISGNVVGINLRARNPGDSVTANCISGDIRLDRVGHSKVEARTVSGEVNVNGPLARGARYDLNTSNGDITFILPKDSSFRLSAKVFQGGDVVTDFPLKYGEGQSTSKVLSGGRLEGTFGTGDASLNLVSHNGTIRLRKQH